MGNDSALLLNRVFTRNAMQEMINGKCPDAYVAAIRRYEIDATDRSNSQLISSIYSILCNDYRNEYFYKNTILNKLLLGVHKPTTTAALTEVAVGKSKADFVLINGRAVAYEIKTELDNLNRLKSQISDYYRAFSRVCVLTCEDHLDAVQKQLEDTPVGIYMLQKSKGNCISRKKEPQEHLEGLDLDAIFRILRKAEFEEIIVRKYGELPDVSQFQYYKECKRLFCNMDIATAYRDFVAALKRRANVDIEMYKDIPVELKFLAYFSELKKDDYKGLKAFLERKEEQLCTSHI